MQYISAVAVAVDPEQLAVLEATVVVAKAAQMAAQIQDTLHFLIQAVAVAVAQVQALQLMPAVQEDLE
jgi:hypothetical protein